MSWQYASQIIFSHLFFQYGMCVHSECRRHDHQLIAVMRVIIHSTDRVPGELVLLWGQVAVLPGGEGNRDGGTEQTVIPWSLWRWGDRQGKCHTWGLKFIFFILQVIHPSIFCHLYPVLGVTGGPIPAILGQRRETLWAGRQFIPGPTQRDKHTHSCSHLQTTWSCQTKSELLLLWNPLLYRCISDGALRAVQAGEVMMPPW